MAEDVFRHVGEAILSGQLKPHERIRDIELARELHVSRMPVREALQRLERIGLVRMYPSRYTEVSEVTDATFEASCEFAGFQSGFVAHLAAGRMDDEQRAEAASMIDRIVAATDDQTTSSLIRRDLFTYLSKHSDNFLQHSLLDEASLALTRNLQRLVRDPAQREASLPAWAALRKAILAGDSSAAERAARAVHGLV
ncbi:GntR family transcriptional regulator [Microbacterium sp. A84]|uniref:GntR family transcriptional regulator n=1 Tax=Microbacterium sp. A84 TaxID=3450715 RepID=UPI003F43F99C